MQLGAKHAATRGHKHVAHPAWVVRRQPECSGVLPPARPNSLNLPNLQQDSVRIQLWSVWCPSGAAPYLGVRHLNTHLWFSLLFLPAPAIPGYPGESAAHQEWLPGLSLLLPTARQASPSPRSEQARIGFAKFVCVVPYDAYYQCFRSCLK